MLDRLFAFDAQFIQDVIIMGINLFILFFALSYLIFNPARDVMNKRRERIASDIETAKKEKEDAIALKNDYEGKLTNINQEAEEILNAARKKALKQEEEILARAKAEAAIVMARANTEIELEKKKAVDGMKQEMITIASMMAGKVVSASMNAQIQDELVDETLSEIGNETWQN
ncbi:MAG: F0F1 ATP synthase subunit B [Lachnospiraceae bacterium]|nr:F0F1 ATP synthase subunit B [Lachnospiraceae bacterium]